MAKYMKKIFGILCIIFLLFFLSCFEKPTENNTVSPTGLPDSSSAGNDTTASFPFGILTDSIENEVAGYRGKPFLRNVETAVFTRSEYQQYLSSGQQYGLTEAEKDLYNRIYIAQGFLRNGDNYFSNMDSMLSFSVAGFYQPGTDSFFIITEDTATIDAYDSATIFHELVHALQDQYYDLNALTSAVTSSDQYFALRYTIEGEAALLEECYTYKLFPGGYPDNAQSIISGFNYYEAEVNKFLDTLHANGERMFIYQPMYWAYYSYGPEFIMGVTNFAWSNIDNIIFRNLPVKTREVMDYTVYLDGARTDYVLNCSELQDYLDSNFLVYDVDEIGVMLLNTMLREWSISNYTDVARDLLSDNMMVFQPLYSDTISVCWYQLWEDSSSAAAFFDNYRNLMISKHGTALPAAGETAGIRSMHNTGSPRMYMEQNGAKIIIMENYPENYHTQILTRIRNTTSATWPASAKRTADGKKYPCIDKYPLKDWVVLPD